MPNEIAVATTSAALVTDVTRLRDERWILHLLSDMCWHHYEKEMKRFSLDRLEDLEERELVCSGNKSLYPTGYRGLEYKITFKGFDYYRAITAR